MTKLNPQGSALGYSTYLGSSFFDSGDGIAVDGGGAAYVTGSTSRDDFPTTAGAFDTTFNGDEDAFVVKLVGNGTALAYATFLGGSDFDYGADVAVDSIGRAHVTGATSSANFPATVGAVDATHNGDDDAYLAVVFTRGSALAYSTYLGGGARDQGVGIAVDSARADYVTGFAYSGDFPVTPGAFETMLQGDSDAFVAKIAPGDGTVPSTSTSTTSTTLPIGPTCAGRAATIVGTGGPDTISGTSGPDVIAAGAGNDTVQALGGDDVICGGDGDDDIQGSSGNDEIFGGDDVDVLAGGGGDDVLAGEGGNDRLNGGAGNDRVQGGPGDDRVLGGAGDDVLEGNGGADVLNAVQGDAGAFADTLTGGPEVDQCFSDPPDTPPALTGGDC